jgi:hypothetical protein
VKVLLAAGTAIATLGLLACGGADGDGNEVKSPTPVTTQALLDTSTTQSERLAAAIADSDPRMLLEDVVLGSTDLPGAFVLVQRSFKTSQEAAQSNALESPNDALARFLQNGRVLSLEAEYQPQDRSTRLMSGDEVIIVLQISATLYETSEGSRAAFEFVEEISPPTGSTSRMPCNVRRTSPA